MLTTEPPVYQLRGVTVFRDHEDPDQFYFLPPPPRLAAVPDRKALALYKYRRDLTDNPALDPARALGAGLALFDLEAALSAEALAAVRVALARESGRSEVRLTPVQFRSGEVRAIVGHEDGERMVVDLMESHAAPLTAPHRATFALALTAQGAALVERAAAGESLPVGAVYELRFLALTPSLHARVDLDYGRAYERLAASLGLRYSCLRAELDGEISRLVDAGAVRIEVTAFVDSDDQKRQEAMLRDLVARRLQSDFFAPTLPPAPTVGGEPSASSAMFVLKARQQVEAVLKAFTLTFDGRVSVELSHIVCGFLSTLVDGATAEVRALDLDDPFFATLNVSVSAPIDFSEMPDLREAIVSVSHGDLRRDFTFSRALGDRAVFRAAIQGAADDEYAYRVEYLFEPDAGHGPTRISVGPLRARSRALTLNPLEHLRYRRLRLISDPFDPAVVLRVRARVRALVANGGEELAREEFEVDPARDAPVFRMRVADLSAAPPLLRVAVTWYDAAGRGHDVDEVDAPGDTFVVRGPFEAVLRLLVVPAVDWTAVRQVNLDLRYDDGDYSVARALLFSSSASQTAEIPLLHGDRRRYRWRTFVVRHDGSINASDAKTAEEAVLVLRDERPRTRELTIALVGEANDLLGVRVELWAKNAIGDEEQASAFVQPGQRVTVTLPLDQGGALRYRYETRRYRAEGDEPGRSGDGDRAMLALSTSE